MIENTTKHDTIFDFVSKLIPVLESTKSNPSEVEGDTNKVLCMQKNLTINENIETIKRLAREYCKDN